ncbi:uncharacterized protein DS421_8g229690 [Arachis hypogaea]|nr:uncharacterized protein DS421_8g229690 [Arachis hypogaea]
MQQLSHHKVFQNQANQAKISKHLPSQQNLHYRKCLDLKSKLPHGDHASNAYPTSFSRYSCMAYKKLFNF